MVGDRPARVAMLVYNDAHADARVLKTAATLQAAGAAVRIFAVARTGSGFPPTSVRLDTGAELVRVPEFDLRQVMPRLGAAHRRLVDALRRSVARTRHEFGQQPGVGSLDMRGRAPSQDGPRDRDEARGAAALGRAGMDILLRVYRTTALVDYWWRVTRATRTWKPDLVHANDGNTLLPALVLSTRGVPFIYDAHELWLHRNVPRRLLAPAVEAVIERLGARTAAGVITVSPSIASWLHRTYRLAVPPTLVRNVPMPAPVVDAPGSLRKLAGLSPEHRVIAYAGRLTTNRGLEETIAALAYLDEGVHLVLLGYGEPDYMALLLDRARAAGLGHRVHAVGAVRPDEVGSALADADASVVYVRPTCLSYRYALPNKLFESIHAGVPVVASDIPDIAQLVRGLGVGEVVAGADAVGLADALGVVMANGSAYRRAARRAAGALTWQAESVGLLGVYSRVLGQDA